MLISIAVFLGEEGQDRGEAAEFDVDIEALDVASVSSWLVSNSTSVLACKSESSMPLLSDTSRSGTDNPRFGI